VLVLREAKAEAAAAAVSAEKEANFCSAEQTFKSAQVRVVPSLARGESGLTVP